MHKLLTSIIFISLLVYPLLSIGANNHDHFVSLDGQKVRIMVPTGDSTVGFPNMRILEDTAELFQSLRPVLDSTFINDFVEIYLIAQTFSFNTGLIDSIEPAYIAITNNEGGFPRKGFVLLDNGKEVIKPETPYVDISSGQALSNPARLMSMTQLYPHELGHVILHMLCREDTVADNTNSTSMHFFAVRTDFSTAFNEGFSEHIENIARESEKNLAVYNGIHASIKEVGSSSPVFVRGFERDLIYSWRIGFYKASMINWYQKYEDYMRQEFATGGIIKYRSYIPGGLSPQDAITFRDSGVRLDTTTARNIVEMHATEGVVSTFFTKMASAGFAEKFMDIGFYKPFISDAEKHITSPREIFTPLQNLFIKYFHVLHQYVTINNSLQSQMKDFVNGYIRSFPEEAEDIKRIYSDVFHQQYENSLPPPLWLLIKNVNHRLLVLDPFGAITVPVYTFDLNAAGTEDLMMIDGMSGEDAERIIIHRENHGFFEDITDLNEISGISEETLQKIYACKLNPAELQNILTDATTDLSLSGLIMAPLQHIFIKAFIYFLLAIAIVWFLVIRGSGISSLKIARIFTVHFIIWIFMVIFTLTATVIFHNPLPWQFGFLAGMLTLAFIVSRKNLQGKKRTMLSVALMILILVGSM